MTRLRLGTYNVHGFVGRDGARDLERVAQVILELESDAVGLQEVDGRAFSTTLEELEHQTGMRAHAGMTLKSEQGEFGNALLSRLPVHRVQRHDLSVPNREPRGAIEVELEAPDGRILSMITSHLGLRRRERRAQVEGLVQILRSCRRRPLVLAGDLNEWWSFAAPLRRLMSVFERGPVPRSFPARRPLLALDRLLVLPHRALLGASAHDSRLARQASDHLPVVAEILVDASEKVSDPQTSA